MDLYFLQEANGRTSVMTETPTLPFLGGWHIKCDDQGIVISTTYLTPSPWTTEQPNRFAKDFVLLDNGYKLGPGMNLPKFVETYRTPPAHAARNLQELYRVAQRRIPPGARLDKVA